VETFGAPSSTRRRTGSCSRKQIDLMLKCSTREHSATTVSTYDCPPAVEYRGYQLTEITCVPRPKHLPVEIWMPIASSKSIDYMASKNFKAMVTLNGEKDPDDVVKATATPARSMAGASSSART